jgi:hypothetical protein
MPTFLGRFRSLVTRLEMHHLTMRTRNCCVLMQFCPLNPNAFLSYRTSKQSRCMSGLLASNWQAWAFAGSRCARSTRSPTPKRKRLSKKLRRRGSRRSAGTCPGQAAGGVVSLRGPSGQDEARVGQQGTLTRIWAARAPRAIPATPGPISSAPCAPNVVPPRRWSCPMPTPRR